MKQRSSMRPVRSLRAVPRHCSRWEANRMPDFVPAATVRVGDTFQDGVDEVTRAMFVRYAGASGDFNPIHWDREFARGAGYQDVFGMGMLTAGILAGFLSRWLGRESVRRVRFRFVDQVWAGERLVGHCRIT